MTNKRYWQLVYAEAILISLALGVIAAHYFLSSASPHQDNIASISVAQLLPEKKQLPNFLLENHRGESINNKVFEGSWSLVFFGFTSCPDICPLELQKLGKLLRLAAAHPVQVVFISVDPERDPTAKLADYVGFFHPKIIGVRGRNNELAQFVRFFGASYDRSVIIDNKVLSVPAGMDMPVNAGDAYQVSHSLRIFIVNPAGEYVGSFAPPYEAETLWADMQIMMKLPAP